MTSPTAEIMQYQRGAWAALGFHDLKEARRLIDWADAAAARSPDLPAAYRGAITGLRERIGRFEALEKAGKFRSKPFEPEDERDEQLAWIEWEKEDKRRAAWSAIQGRKPAAYTNAQRRGPRKQGRYI